ncbi:MAG: hypothetical protein IKH15_08385 [Bacteroidales bacterium]|nr:hypothetical protein [Bacteroidales bacterium]
MKKLVCLIVYVFSLTSCGSYSDNGGYAYYSGNVDMEMRLRALEEKRRHEAQVAARRAKFKRTVGTTFRYATKSVMEYLFNNIGRGDKATLKSNFSEAHIRYDYDAQTAYVPVVITWKRYINWINDQRDTRISGTLYYSGFKTCRFFCTDAENVKKENANLIFHLKSVGIVIE